MRQVVFLANMLLILPGICSKPRTERRLGFGILEDV